jgi:carbamoyltransferase
MSQRIALGANEKHTSLAEQATRQTSLAEQATRQTSLAEQATRQTRHVVIGVNAFHADSAAALVINGQLICAVEEERFRRVKHWAGFPSMAIEFCLKEAGVNLSQVAAIAINQDVKAARAKRVWFALKNRPSISLVLEKLKTKRTRASLKHLLEQHFVGQEFRGQIMPVEHHLAHLASAFDCSPFERAVVASIDGFGDFASGAFGLGEGFGLAHVLRPDGHIYFPDSLGIFYQSMTQYLGFRNYGDEYKVMGLAPYGKAVHKQALQALLSSKADGRYALELDYFRHHRDKLEIQIDNGDLQFAQLYSNKLIALLGPAREPGEELSQYHRDLAASVQAVYEDAAFAFLNQLHARYGLDQLTLAGGCAQNSVANGKITERTPFKRVYVAAAGADSGGAIGAALVGARRCGMPRTNAVLHAYLGTQYSDSECERAIANAKPRIEAESVQVRYLENDQELYQSVVDRIIQGHVVGWFQGRMEWGPRALGNRSILADPRRHDVKDILNLKIKRRESFRPFAPSILREHVSEWFEQDADVPFMAQVFPIRAEKRGLIPAVTHVDGSGRLQTVTRESNARYFDLIECFYKSTGVPILVNTSFNENEPVVCRPEEALACFLRTKMDVLVLGNWLLSR